MSCPPPAPAPSAAAGLGPLVAACLRRFLAQNGKAPLSEPELADWSGRFAALVERELRRSGRAEDGSGEMPASLVETLSDEMRGEGASLQRGADLEVPLRQLLKACLQAEPVRCRESYREVVSGRCRRQELARTRGRISGVHCVDCPHWLALDPGQNAGLVERAWVEGPVTGFHDHREVYLPEDFRALRKAVRKQI